MIGSNVMWWGVFQDSLQRSEQNMVTPLQNNIFMCTSNIFDIQILCVLNVTGGVIERTHSKKMGYGQFKLCTFLYSGEPNWFNMRWWIWNQNSGTYIYDSSKIMGNIKRLTITVVDPEHQQYRYQCKKVLIIDELCTWQCHLLPDL